MGNNKRAARKKGNKKGTEAKRFAGGSTKANSWKTLKCCPAKELIYVLSARERETERERERKEMNCKLQLKLRLN